MSGLNNVIYLDFETYYDSDFSLTKMDPIQYVLDPRLQIHGAALAIGYGPVVWVANDASGTPEAFARRLDEVVRPDLWANHAICAWNCRFDASVLWWRVGRKPRRYLDPMAMARGMVGHLTKGVSLDRCASLFGLPGKIQGALANVRGLSTAEIYRRGLMEPLGQYGIHDVDLARTMFLRMTKAFPDAEMRLVDALVRIFVEPGMHLDAGLLDTAMTAIATKRREILERLKLTPEALRSDNQFAALLRAAGVEPPMKTSPATGQQVYAFAKTDLDFVALQEDDSVPEEARLLVEARLGVKSSIEATRTQRLLDISRLVWPAHMGGQGFLPAPLAYYAAHTGRLGGDYRINLQNLGRDSPIRQAIHAPDGYVFVVADAMQIEARVNAWLAGQDDLVAAFARGEDVYSSFASTIFGYPVNKKDHPNERFLGKTGILSLGFGASPPKFQWMVAHQSKRKIVLPDAEAERIVRLYRGRYEKIPLLWTRCMGAIKAIADGNTDFRIGPVRVATGGLDLPNGMRLHYRNLACQDGQWTAEQADGNRKNIWHGLVCENIVQALARIAVMEARQRVEQRMQGVIDGRFVLTVHDDLGWLARKGPHADLLLETLIDEMRRPPTWAPGLPLDAEGGIGRTYSEAK